ncbi:MAG: hypothetical protein RIS35_383 [Pseudomonadota bacterium]|jgi:hypothetical protein
MTAPAGTDRLAERFATPVSGPAYRRSAKWMVGSTILSLCSYGAKTVAEHDFGWNGWLVLALGTAAVLVTGWSVLTGKTMIDARGIRQDGVPRKEFGWHEIVRARRLRMPFTCRLLISTGKGPLKAIHGGNAELDRAFADIESLLSPRP